MWTKFNEKEPGIVWNSASFLRYFRYFWGIHRQSENSINYLWHVSLFTWGGGTVVIMKTALPMMCALKSKDASVSDMLTDTLPSNNRWLRGICWHFEKVRHLVPSEMHYSTWDIPRGLSGVWEPPGWHMPSCSNSSKPQDLDDLKSTECLYLSNWSEWLTGPKMVSIGFLATRWGKVAADT